jgi:hypothetical protein
MTSLQLSGSAPPDRGLYPELATIVDKSGTSAGNVQKGDSLGDSVGPYQNLVLSANATTGDLSASHLQMEDRVPPPMIDGSQGLLSRLHFLASMLRHLR